ncbi:MAG: Narbonolide/10-deoxymethynolide synthase PikA2, modules 3 and 4 [Anaerolineae bacterium]|nr:Narbonolide/10-deoxymethynolide synthase PikA2, modules 3 and 4 [Anaerolineae bacterium]
MKAIVVQQEVEGRPLLWQDVPDPAFGPDEVLINIHAAALNRADLAQRAGNYPPPPGASDILGLEMAGTITALGAEVSGWQVGDRVCALLPGGGYAEKVNVPAQLLLPLPEDWSFEQGAALPEVFLTAYVNLFMEADLQAGETVLIHGGASGVGTAAIQLAHQAGCRVFTTAGTDDKVAYCRQLGADLAINYREEDFVERILAEADGVDVILDMVGANYLESNIRLLKLRGRLVFIATMGGGRAEIDIWRLMGRRLRLIGSVLRARPVAEKIEIKERFMAQFWKKFLDGTLSPIIDSVYPVAQAEQAHAHMQQNQNIGKIILKIRD